MEPDYIFLEPEQEELLHTLYQAYLSVSRSERQDFVYHAALTMTKGVIPIEKVKEVFHDGGTLLFEGNHIYSLEELPANWDSNIIAHPGLPSHQLSNILQTDIDYLVLQNLIAFRDNSHFYITPRSQRHCVPAKPERQVETQEAKMQVKPRMKPTLFIGSSVESLPIARAINSLLDHDAEVTVWEQGIFQLSKSTLQSLVEALNKFQFGVFVLSPDDIATIRKETKQVIRDNVIFELGLFFGKLGLERTFFVIPRDVTDLHLPTDLLGITPAKYNPHRSDQNWRAALGPACDDIRIAMQNLAVPEKPAGSYFPIITMVNDRLGNVWTDGNPNPRHTNRTMHQGDSITFEVKAEDPQGNEIEYAIVSPYHNYLNWGKKNVLTVELTNIDIKKECEVSVYIRSQGSNKTHFANGMHWDDFVTFVYTVLPA